MRICIEVSLGVPVRIHICIGHLTQKIEYEREDILCKGCGMIGHTLSQCPTSSSPQTNHQTEKSSTSAESNPAHQKYEGKNIEGWTTVAFNKKKGKRGSVRQRTQAETSSSSQSMAASPTNNEGLNVLIFYANTDKYLDQNS